jgi:signal transduction histidine kinase
MENKTLSIAVLVSILASLTTIVFWLWTLQKELKTRKTELEKELYLSKVQSYIEKTEVESKLQDKDSFYSPLRREAEFFSLSKDRKLSQIERDNREIKRALDGLLIEIKRTWNIDEVSKPKFNNNYLNGKSDVEGKLEYISNLASDVAHTLKTPISGIKISLELLKKELGESNPLDKIYNLEKNVEILEETIAGYAQLGKLDFKDDESINLKKAIENSFTLLSLSIGKKINIEFSIPQGIRISNDKYKCLLIPLASIIQNAFDATPDNGIVRIIVEKESDSLKFKIYNSGSSIENEEFDVYQRGVSAKGSSGLGLPIAKEIIEEKFNGTIFYENELDGVTFIITIPWSADVKE